MGSTLAVHPLDLEPFRDGGAAARCDVARQLDLACQDSGFLLVSGHGVPDATCDAALAAFAEFFDRPIADKERVVSADLATNRGYSAIGREGLAYSRGDVTPPDLFEAFNLGAENTEGAYYDRHRGFFAPNVWPEGASALRTAWLRYEAAAAQVAEVLLRAMALALDLSETWFTGRLEHAIITTRAINYERRAAARDPEPGQMRMGAHTDYGVLTVLLADDVPGLQVFRDGHWHDVRIPRGSFVCNIGDMLARWTNDRWTSTLHRVVPPPTTADGPVRRRSIARFLDCPPDLVVETIPACIDTGHPARYEPVVAGEWLRAKLLRGRSRELPDRSPTLDPDVALPGGPR